MGRQGQKNIEARPSLSILFVYYFHGFGKKPIVVHSPTNFFVNGIIGYGFIGGGSEDVIRFLIFYKIVELVETERPTVKIRNKISVFL